MQVVNKKMCVIVMLVLVIIESCTLFLMYKSFGNKNTNLDEVNLNINNTNMFAIMLEQSDGTYKEDTTSTWPTSGYTYNESMSGCIDINGNRIDNALTYDKENNKASVNTTNTSYCYLYFSLPKWCNEDETASECLLRNPSSGLNSTIVEAGMYRYQGNSNNNDVVNNYACFGTSNKESCLGNTDVYMYRVIGINENNQLKLIKKEALNSIVEWYGDITIDITWPDSLIYTTLNGNDYLLNDTYVPTGWESKIVTYDWKYGDTTSYGNFDGPTIFAIENAWQDTVSAKIGLMYIHDYYYAYASEGAPGSYSNAKTAWIHLSENDSNAPSSAEWTMSRYGKDEYGDYYAKILLENGNVPEAYFFETYSVRPVFYLTSDIKITGGSGKIDDPFIIS